MSLYVCMSLCLSLSLLSLSLSVSLSLSLSLPVCRCISMYVSLSLSLPLSVSVCVCHGVSLSPSPRPDVGYLRWCIWNLWRVMQVRDVSCRVAWSALIIDWHLRPSDEWNEEGLVDSSAAAAKYGKHSLASVIIISSLLRYFSMVTMDAGRIIGMLMVMKTTITYDKWMHALMYLFMPMRTLHCVSLYIILTNLLISAIEFRLLTWRQYCNSCNVLLNLYSAAHISE